MKRWQLSAGCMLVGVLAFGLVSMTSGQPMPDSLPAFLKVKVPVGAILEIEGIKTTQVGEMRTFISPPLTPGKKYEYNLKATILDGGKTIVRETKVAVTPGEEAMVDLTVDPKKEEPKKEEKKEDKKEMKKEEKKKEDKKEMKKEEKKEEPKKEEKKEEKKEMKKEEKKEPKKEEPKVEPKKVEPKKEEPKVEPKKEMKKEEPKVEPKKVEPKKEELKVEPKKELPKVEPKQEAPEEATIKVPFVPTPHEVVEAMLKMASIKEGDVVYDLGCGDGRIVVSAVKDFKAAKGFGLDLNAERVKDSEIAAKKAGVADKVTFKQGDVLKMETVADANVVTLYLLPEVNERIKPMLQKTLRAGSRIVSHDFDMGDWKADKELVVTDQDGNDHRVYLWIVK